MNLGGWHCRLLKIWGPLNNTQNCWSSQSVLNPGIIFAAWVGLVLENVDSKNYKPIFNSGYKLPSFLTSRQVIHFHRQRRSTGPVCLENSPLFSSLGEVLILLLWKLSPLTAVEFGTLQGNTARYLRILLFLFLVSSFSNPLGLKFVKGLYVSYTAPSRNAILVLEKLLPLWQRGECLNFSL